MTATSGRTVDFAMKTRSSSTSRTTLCLVCRIILICPILLQNLGEQSKMVFWRYKKIKPFLFCREGSSAGSAAQLLHERLRQLRLHKVRGRARELLSGRRKTGHGRHRTRRDGRKSESIFKVRIKGRFEMMSVQIWIWKWVTKVYICDIVSYFCLTFSLVFVVYYVNITSEEVGAYFENLKIHGPCREVEESRHHGGSAHEVESARSIATEHQIIALKIRNVFFRDDYTVGKTGEPYLDTPVSSPANGKDEKKQFYHPIIPVWCFIRLYRCDDSSG